MCNHNKSFKDSNNTIRCSNCFTELQEKPKTYKFWALLFIIGIALTSYTNTPVKYYKDNSKLQEITAPLQLDYQQIIKIESNNDFKAISSENARGLMQITPCVLEEWNKANKQQYTINDLYNPVVNTLIGKWAFQKMIPSYLKKYKIANTIHHKLIIYNWGIGSYLIWRNKGERYEQLPQETRNYLLKYWEKY